MNYHHLQYFHAVAMEGHLTRAAKRLRISQSALSSQIRQLEEQLGQPLFLRERRALILTEAGRQALVYAEQIFTLGRELTEQMSQGRAPARETVRIGAVATLSRNFLEQFLAPILADGEVQIVLQSASLRELLSRLSSHALDLVLSNQAVQGDAGNGYRCQRIGHQPVSLVGRARSRRFRFPHDLAGQSLLLPSRESDIRAAFELLCERHRITFKVRAEVDDMAMLRLLARDVDAIALVPRIVVKDELKTRAIRELCRVPGLYEDFYMTTVKRRFVSAWVTKLNAPATG